MGTLQRCFSSQPFLRIRPTLGGKDEKKLPKEAIEMRNRKINRKQNWIGKREVIL